MEIDHGIVVGPLPINCKEQRQRADGGEDQDEVRLEPIVALSFVENDLQRSETDRHQTKAYVVDMSFVELTAPEVRRIFDEARREKNRKDAYRNVNEENPSPGEVVRNPSAESWTDGRRGHHRDAVNSKRHAAFRCRKSVRQNRLLAGLQAAPAGALQNAEENEGREIGRQAAKK